MTKEEKDKILKALTEDRNDFARDCERRIAEEQGKVTGADYMIQRFLDILKTIDNSDHDYRVNTHIVIKRKDMFKYLTDNQIKYLDTVLNTVADGRKKDGKKPDNSYYICNTDEPYADEVLEVILKAESEMEK